ncbi:MAG: GntR family transcriptional regulator [Peptostreptococcaceae bacterium]|nr:GntR family transcriptional regulator [Peptostreptococcaceae bacterium]
MAKKNSIPVYLQVAVDVAGRISRKELIIGQKLSGRTILAGEYNVSPETIRKAMKLLSDVNIVEVKYGNGVHVLSIDRAEEFIEQYRIKASVNELKEELLELMEQRDLIENKMNETMNSIVDYTSRFKNSDHISVNEYYLNYGESIIEKTLMELDLKNNTGATIVGIKRDGITILSPDDEEVIRSKDKLLYVGIPNSSVKLGEYLRIVYGI